MNLFDIKRISRAKARLEKEREGEVVRRKRALFEEGKGMGEETLFGQHPHDGIEREYIGFVKQMEDSESIMRWVMANETSGYQIVLVSTNSKDSSMDLKKMRV